MRRPRLGPEERVVDLLADYCYVATFVRHRLLTSVELGAVLRGRGVR